MSAIRSTVSYTHLDVYKRQVYDKASLKRCLQAILAHPKAEEEDNVLYRSQLGTHVCIRSSGIETSMDEKGSDVHA